MKRTSVVNLLGLGAGVGTLYIMISFLSTMKNPSETIDSDLAVNVKSIVPGADGKLDIVLSIDIEDIVKHMKGFQHANGEATSNPVPRETNLVKNVADLCSAHPPRYIVYVHTSPANEKRRALVRSTWGNRTLFQDGRLQIVFMTGLPTESKDQLILDRESDTYGDIVQGDFLDTYHNLTFKGLMGLKWVSTYCPQAKFTIKADDDAFVNIFDLLQLIESERDGQRVIMCPIWRANSMPILRDPAKCMKWCVKYSEFPGLNFFPQYCAGLTYVLSTDIVGEMSAVSRTTPYFWIDDVYITGILPGKLSNIHDVNFMSNFTLKENVARDDYTSSAPKTQYMVVHVKTEAIWHTLWEAALRRVSNEVLKTLGNHVIRQYPELDRRQRTLITPKQP
jgi:hypothetical protein